MSFTQTNEFQHLRTLVKGDIVLPEDPSYKDAIQRWSKLAEKPAGAVILVKDAQDVSTDIQYVAANKVSFAVKGKSALCSVPCAKIARSGLFADEVTRRGSQSSRRIVYQRRTRD